jgi:YidC/Oxa1 family membrane protein insertase
MQQRLVYTKIDKEEAARKAEAAEKRASLGPKPGQKPTAPKVGQKPVQQKKNPAAQGGSAKKVTKAGSPHGFAQTTPADASGPNGSKDNGTGVPGLLKDSTRKSGRKRR